MAKFLIVRFSSIGDIVLTTPIVRCLKQQVDGAEVHFITKKVFAGLMESNPHVDQVHTIEDSVFEITDELKEVGFDYIIDLHNNLRSRQLRRELKVLSFDYPKHNLAKWLLVNFKLNRMPKNHIVDRYFEAVSSFRVKSDGEGLDYFIPEEEELDPQNEFGFSDYIAYGIGGRQPGKIFPEDKIVKTLQLLTQAGKNVVLLGGPEDRDRADRIRDKGIEIRDERAEISGSGRALRVPGSGIGQVINRCGDLSMNGSASVVRQASSVISHDTAIMHIAAAFKKKVISIWGCTVPEFGMYPYKPGEGSKMIQMDGLRQRPCSKLGIGTCAGFACMNSIKEEQITKSV